jgi:hypothetical protein
LVADLYVDQIATIPDDALLYRRTIPRFVDWSDLDATGAPRLTSGCFQYLGDDEARKRGYPGPAMSIGLGTVLAQLGESPMKMLEGFEPTYGLAILRAGAVREKRQGIFARPTEQEPWHGVVFCKDDSLKRKTIHAMLAEIAAWYHVPARP